MARASQQLANLQLRFIDHGLSDEAALCAAKQLWEKVVTNKETPPFYVLQTLLGFSGPDLNRVVLRLPDESEFILCEMGEPRTEKDGRRWQALAERLSLVWHADRLAHVGLD